MPPKAKRATVATIAKEMATLKPGLVFKTRRHEYKLGKLLGAGGHGKVFLCDKATSGGVTAAAPYVIKLEHKDTPGHPMDMEASFMDEFCKDDRMSKHCKEHKIARDMVAFPEKVVKWDQGNFNFIVMERLSMSVDAMLDKCSGTFSEGTVALLAKRVLCNLRYFHPSKTSPKGWVHGDIKSENLMTGRGKKEKRLYLLDYGTCNMVKPAGGKAKAAPRGTSKYMSIGSHEGCGYAPLDDFEGLLYCMGHWYRGSLPWTHKTKPCDILAQKRQWRADPVRYTKKMFAPGVPPALLVDFAKLVAAEDSATHLLPSTVYAKALALFDRALTKCKAKDMLHFTCGSSTASKGTSGQLPSENEEDASDELIEEKEIKATASRKPSVSKTGSKKQKKTPATKTKAEPDKPVGEPCHDVDSSAAVTTADAEITTAATAPWKTLGTANNITKRAAVHREALKQQKAVSRNRSPSGKQRTRVPKGSAVSKSDVAENAIRNKGASRPVTQGSGSGGRQARSKRTRMDDEDEDDDKQQSTSPKRSKSDDAAGDDDGSGRRTRSGSLYYGAMSSCMAQ